MAYVNRRNFLRSAAGFAAAVPMMDRLMGENAYAADAAGYKALICLTFKGGVDGNDWLMPTDAQPYAEMAAKREALIATYTDGSRARENLLPVGQAGNGISYGLPSNLGGFADLINAGKGRIVANVGPLAEPVTRATWNNRAAARPRKLFSHNDQQSTWLTGDVEGAPTGWGGRFMDTFISAGVQDAVYSTPATTSSRHAFLNGDLARELVIPTGRPRPLNYIRRRSAMSYRAGIQPAFNQLMLDHLRAGGVSAANPYAKDLADIARRGIDNLARYNEVMDAVPDPVTPFSTSSVSQQFAQIARTIAAAGTFGVKRQVFYVQAPGGYDTHGAQAGAQARLTQTATAVTEFMAEMERAGLSDDVTVFTASDFGRTLTTSGSGTDHGWGSHHFVFGGAINGDAPSKIIGSPPDYDLDGGLYTDRRGRLIPEIAVDQYAATLGKWFGLNETDLAGALPNLSNFNQKDLGLFASV